MAPNRVVGPQFKQFFHLLPIFATIYNSIQPIAIFVLVTWVSKPLFLCYTYCKGLKIHNQSQHWGIIGSFYFQIDLLFALWCLTSFV
jgi:hypothetical protein